MAEIYTDVIVDHFKHPRNAGVLEDADALGRVENPASGAAIVFYLKVAQDHISRAMFQAQGCTATIAAASMLTEMAVGRSVDQVAQLKREEIEIALGGLPPTRKHAAALAEDAARAAVADYRVRAGC